MRNLTVPTPKNSHLAFALLLIGVLILSFAIRVIFLNNFVWGYDEGIHVLLAQLLAAGYTPYTELFVSYPPLFVWSLEWPWRIWGTMESIQLLMTVYALLGVATVGVVGFRLGGTIAGLLATIFLSLAPIYLDGSRAVMTEVPSVGVATLAVGLAAIYYWRGGRGWLLASGVAVAASLMLKVLSPYILGLIPLMILVRQVEQTRQNQQAFTAGVKPLIIDGLIWGAGVFIPILITLILYDPVEMYRQVVTFRVDTRVEYQEDWSENLEMLLWFVQHNPALMLAAVWGIGIIIFRQLKNGWFVLLWLVLAVIFALIQVPLREKHLPLLLPPLAILAGLGLAAGFEQLVNWVRHPQQTGLRAIVAAVVAITLFVGYVWQLQGDFTAIAKTTTTPLNEQDQMLADYLQQFTSPTDCLVTDNPTLAFFANRPTPPNLSEVSSARLRSGYLTYDELVTATQDYGCQVVAPVAKRIKRTRPDFVEWSKQNLTGLWLYDGGTEILLAQPLVNPRPEQAINTKLGDMVELVGYDLIPQGNALYVSLYWQALQPLPEDYTIFVHLRDAANNTIANADHQPYNNLVPTSRWPVGETIKETIRLDIPPDLPNAQYRLLAGMYSPVTVERLPVQNDTSGENAVILHSSLLE